MSKVVSGDDDLPKRDDIGERRRKHELRVLAGAGLKSEHDVDEEIAVLGSKEIADEEDGERGDSENESYDLENESHDSENELYEQIKRQRSAKLAAKAEIYSRYSIVPFVFFSSCSDCCPISSLNYIWYEPDGDIWCTIYNFKIIAATHSAHMMHNLCASMFF